MKLRTGTPLWLADSAVRLPNRRLRGVHECDVAIVGAGVTGALVAEQLLQAGLRVIMLDQRSAGYGSTAASTGLLLYQPDSSIGDLTRRHGRRTAERVYQLGRQAIRELGRLVRRRHLDCGWKAKRTLYVASRPRDVALLRAEAKRTKAIGFSADLVAATGLRRKYDLNFAAALAAEGAAHVHALNLTRGLLEHWVRNPHFALHQRTRVRTVRERGDTVRLTTDAGEIRARFAVIAAGYESRQFVQSRLISFHSTYVIASRPFSPRKLKPVRCLMWETARPYFYLRTTTDHRIVFGGLDDPFANASRRDRRLPMKTRQLERRFATLFPGLAFRADYAWTGTFADTRDGLPCIGPSRRGSRVLYALGYGGNGITFSQIAAKLLCDACLGRPNRDAKFFGFDRAGG